MNSENHLVPAALPLAVLLAVQDLDAPMVDGLDEFHADLSTKRFGLSETVASRIDHLDRLVRSGDSVDAEQLVALLRLVGRRHDAALVFSDAGRRAGRMAVPGGAASGFIKVLPGAARQRAGFRMARRRALRTFGVRLTQPESPTATLSDPLPVRATEDGAACGFYGAGVAEILRELVDFEGAMIHTRCRGRGGEACEWHAVIPRPDTQRA